MDRGSGTVSVSSHLHINRVGGIISPFNDIFVEKTTPPSQQESKEASPYCLGGIPHRNYKDFSYSRSSLIEDIFSGSDKLDKRHIDLSSVQYLKRVQWKQNQEFYCFLPQFRVHQPNPILLPIRMGCVGKSIRDIFKTREPPKRLGHHCPGGDITLPLQHGFFIIGELVTDRPGEIFLVMSLNSSENPMVGIYDPFVPTKVAGMKTTVGKIRIGGEQMQFLFFESFLSQLESRESVDTGKVAWKLAATQQESFPLPTAPKPVADQPIINNGPPIPMDELLAVIDSEDDEEMEIDDSTPTNSTPTPTSVPSSENNIKPLTTKRVKPATFENPPTKSQKVSTEHKIPMTFPLYGSKLYDIEIPSPLKNIDQLQSIHINMTSFPDTVPSGGWKFPINCFCRFVNLSNIHITQPNLELFPSDIEYLTNLQFLTINNAKFKTIPLSSNGVSVLPQSLVYLDLSDNELDSFPTSNLPSLKYLNLQCNSLSSFSDCFQSMGELSYLNLFGNNLCSIPTSLKSCKFLTTLLISNNQISQLPEDFFNEFSYLRRLDMSRLVKKKKRKRV